jgi:hypothetical protein
MEEDAFKKAVDSLEGFPRTIGVMGGEPTLHPKFEVFARYIAEKHPPTYKHNPARWPVRNFIRYMWDKNYFWHESMNTRHGPGFWGGGGQKYYEYFETIQDAFPYQLINDHKNNAMHQPLLVSRKDLGITDEEWLPLRDACWIQNMWSATATPKGAFFCEVAGALDMLFDGPGGWPVEPGWWKREPEEFGEQLKWCELCGAALRTKGRLSSEEIDDVSPTLYEMLEKAGSPKLRQGRVALLGDDKLSETNLQDKKNWYIDSYMERISAENKSLFPRELKKLQTAEPFDLAGLLAGAGSDWVLAYAGEEPRSAVLEDIYNYVLNPGVVYPFGGRAALFNVRASALRGVSGSFDFAGFTRLWPDGKRAELTNWAEEDVNPDLEYWAAFAKESGALTEQVRAALNKIASDYGRTVEI